MPIIANPHQPYQAHSNEVVNSSCESGCIEKYIPKRLRPLPLFENVNKLMCHFENSWSDTEIREYLTTLEDFYRTSNSGNLTILNWFSLMNWLDASDYNWYDSLAGDISSGDDFYARYPLSTEDIWLSFSSANEKQFDEDGFKYYSWFLKPYIGTSLIQKKLLEKLDNVDAEVIDWYQENNIINGYSFLFSEFPGWEKAKVLIIGSKLLKNAESILLSIKDENCPNRFILSHSHLDTDYLSGITSLKFEGVNICFQRFRNGISSLFGDFSVSKFYTKRHEYLVQYFNIKKLSDDFLLDDYVENKIYSVKSSIHKGKFVQLLPAWFQYDNKWSASVTWEDHYDWETILINNLVRKYIDNEREPLYWDSVDVWGRWIGWEGDPEDWSYMKPSADREQYFSDSNFIQGFEPLTQRSFYKPLIFSKNTKEII